MLSLILSGVLLLGTGGKAYSQSFDIDPGIEGPPLPPVKVVLVSVVPLAFNALSIRRDTPGSRFWHWSGYAVGGTAGLFGLGTLAESMGDHGPAKIVGAAMGVVLIGYGFLHIAAARRASTIEPESPAGDLVPVFAPDETGGRRMGLAWVKRF